MVVDDAVGIGPVLAPVGRRSASIDRLDRSPPDERIEPRTRCSFLVTRDPAQPAVVGRQCHRHTLAVVTGADAVVEVAVVGHQGAQGPGRIERGVLRQRGVKPSNPAGGCRHELGHALCAHGRDRPGARRFPDGSERRTSRPVRPCPRRHGRCARAPSGTAGRHAARRPLALAAPCSWPQAGRPGIGRSGRAAGASQPQRDSQDDRCHDHRASDRRQHEGGFVAISDRVVDPVCADAGAAAPITHQVAIRPSVREQRAVDPVCADGRQADQAQLIDRDRNLLGTRC